MYTYPEMPLRANVWWEMHAPPADEPPDELDWPLSLSPISPADYFRCTAELQGPYFATHIIRMPTSEKVSESHVPGNATEAYPCTVFEIPAGSGHFYVTTWAHIVGAGFANEHHRVYVTRYGDTLSQAWPLFRGYI